MPRLWYLRKHDDTLGPFPAGAIVADRLVGRITGEDQLSPDEQEWRTFDTWPELVALAQESTGAATVAPEWLAERAKARLRWLDQRSRRAGDDSQSEQGGEVERRTASGADDQRRSARRIRTSVLREPTVLRIVLAIVLCVAIVSLLAWLYGPVNPVPVRIH